MIESVLLSETKTKRFPVFYKELQNNDHLGANFGGTYGIFGIFVVNCRELPFFIITPVKLKCHFRSF